MSTNTPSTPLWTKDFTIITAGSVISMLGSSLSGFAMSLLVLDLTQSTFLFALYHVLFMVPSIVVPTLSGPFLDRFSRKRVIYTLDFISAGLYVVLAGVLAAGWFHFAVLAAATLLLGTINSIYYVAYDSFYPLLITKGNFQKAYSVASTLETLTMVMVPVSAVVYDWVGIVPLFLANGVTYFAAALLETRITAREEYLQTRRPEGGRLLRKLTDDFKEGMTYLVSEKGLLAVALYFTASSFAFGVSDALTLPYFESTFEQGKYLYMLVWGTASVTRAVGGLIHYKWKLPVAGRFGIALAVYVLTNLFDGVYLYFPLGVMMLLAGLNGILGVTSYTIRIAATQNYVPDEKKGRFNGTFQTMNMMGTVAGSLLSGALAEVLPMRGIITCVMLLTVVAALGFIGGNRRHVAAIYNTDN